MNTDKHRYQRILSVFLCLHPWLIASAAVDGTVVNGTNGMPQPNATVTLYKLGEAGMESLETVKSDAQGKFRIEKTPRGPNLLQAAWDGVTYNHMLPPGSSTSGVKIEVFNSTVDGKVARATTHMILYEPGASELAVQESIVFNNDSKLSYNDPARGTLRIFLPEATGGKAKVMARAPQGMPIARAVDRTAQANIYKIDFPIKPGETRIDVSYAMPFASPGSIEGRVLHGGDAVRLVAPAGVTLSGEAIKLVGQEPSTQASVYEPTASEFKVEIQGSGALRGAEGGEEEGGEGIKQIDARVYDRFYPILILALAALLLVFLLQYRRSTAAEAPSAPAPTPKKEKRR